MNICSAERDAAWPSVCLGHADSPVVLTQLRLYRAECAVSSQVFVGAMVCAPACWSVLGAAVGMIQELIHLAAELSRSGYFTNSGSGS